MSNIPLSTMTLQYNRGESDLFFTHSRGQQKLSGCLRVGGHEFFYHHRTFTPPPEIVDNSLTIAIHDRKLTNRYSNNDDLAGLVILVIDQIRWVF